MTVLLLFSCNEQGHLLKKAFNWRFVYSFRGQVHDQHGDGQADRHGSRSVAECLHMVHRQEAERARLGLAWAFETSKSISTDIILPTRPHLLIISKQFTNWEPNIQIHEPMRATLIQTTTLFICHACQSVSHRFIKPFSGEIDQGQTKLHSTKVQLGELITLFLLTEHGWGTIYRYINDPKVATRPLPMSMMGDFPTAANMESLPSTSLPQTIHSQDWEHVQVEQNYIQLAGRFRKESLKSQVKAH